MERRTRLTQLLQEGAGSEALLPLVYEELRAIAAGRMGVERAGHTLQATALVHEAYVRLLADERPGWRDRGHFFAAAAEAMRRILIDHARRVRSQKRGGDLQRVTLGGREGSGGDLELGPDELIALDEALERLAAEDPRAAEVTRLRFFAGLSVEETAAALELSVRSVHREWAFARARLVELLG